jgi:hypothetical protein
MLVSRGVKCFQRPRQVNCYVSRELWMLLQRGAMLVPLLSLNMHGADGVAQRLKQGNLGDSLALTAEDFLFARRTPSVSPIGGIMRCVCIRIAKNGFAERSIHDMAPRSSSFWHYRTEVAPNSLDQLAIALGAARSALAAVEIEQDPNGFYRRIDYWNGDEKVTLRMKDASGKPEHDVPQFETAWSIVLAQFPKEPVFAYAIERWE